MFLSLLFAITASCSPLLSKSQFLQLTDLHYDPYYVLGSSYKEACHRFSLNVTEDVAGKFGHHICDSPLETINSVFKAATSFKNQFDFVIVSGDYYRHQELDPSIPMSQAEFDHVGIQTVQRITKVFPDVPIVTCIGNNDLLDHNTVTVGDKNLELLSTFWEGWIPTSQIEQFKQIGSYYVDVDDLRIVSMNTLFFYKDNHESSCDNATSPGSILLSWIDSTLSGAKKALVFGHIPPLTSKYKSQCLDGYVKVMEKHHSILIGSLFGHTNEDEITFLKDSNENDKNIPLFHAPSIIPIYNPSFRVFTMNNSGLIKYDQYYADILKDTAQLKFTLEYSTDDDYKMDDLSVASVKKFHKKLSGDAKLSKLYEKHKTVSYVQ